VPIIIRKWYDLFRTEKNEPPHPSSLRCVAASVGCYNKFQILRLLESEKQIPRRRSDGDAVRAVAGRDGIAAGDPAPASHAGILLQRVSARVRPGNLDAIWCDKRDGQVRQAGGLHHGNQRPEPAGERIIAAGHRPAGIMLSDGAADLIRAAGARAAAAGDFIPVNGVLLGMSERSQRQKDSGKSKPIPA